MRVQVARARADLLDRLGHATRAALLVARPEDALDGLACHPAAAAHRVCAGRVQGEVVLDRGACRCLLGNRRAGGRHSRQLIEILLLRLSVRAVGVVPPLVPERQRRPEPLVVWIVDGVAFADEADAWASVSCTPGLQVPLERVALAVLHCGHRVDELLLCRRQAGEVLAGRVDLDTARHLHLATVLLDWLAESSSDGCHEADAKPDRRQTARPKLSSFSLRR